MKKTLIVICTLVTGSLFAEEAVIKGICWRYSVSGKSARIEGFGNMPEKNGKSAEELNQKMRDKIANKSLAIPGKIGQYTVTEIGENAFSIDGPGSITVPASVTRIGSFAFGGNKNLTSVTLPPKLTEISEALFMGCVKLASIKIPSSVKSIGTEVFAECGALKTVTIPEGVERIDRQAFRDCSNLVSVVIAASVTHVGEAAFIRCGKLGKIDVAKGSRTYKSVDGALYSRDGTTLVACPEGARKAAVVIPDGVTCVKSLAFSSPAITSITFPSSVTNIEDFAFCCPKLAVIYAQPGDLERLKAVIAEHNPKHGQEVEGRTYRSWMGYRYDMDNVRIEEKPGK